MLDATQLIMDLQDLRDEGHLSDALLRRAVKTIEQSDPRFDWVGAFLLDTEKDDLWLHNYVGSPTEHARVPVGTSTGGRAVAEACNLNVPDVSEVEDYLANDAHARSELVVLIRAGEDIFGEIDLASSEEAAFTEQDEHALQGVADKLAEQIAAERR